MSRKKSSVRNAAERYGVPRSTVQDRIKALNSGREAAFRPKLGRCEHTFSEEYSDQLHKHVKDLDSLMPLTRIEFLKLAYQFAVCLKISHRFNKKKMAGNYFLQLHEEISRYCAYNPRID